MEVILLEMVENLGNIGDKVNVKSGYGRNYLLPQGKATLATAENLAIFEARRAELESRQAEELAAAQARADKLQGLELPITAKVGVEGKLFGSLGTIDIAEACTAAGTEVQRSEVRLPDGPLKSVGKHEVEIHLHSEVNAIITVDVIGDGADAELMESLVAEEADEAENSADAADESSEVTEASADEPKQDAE